MSFGGFGVDGLVGASGAAKTAASLASPMGWLQAASPLLSSAMSSAPNVSSATSSNYGQNTFDNSGFIVNQGGGSVTTSQANKWIGYACIGAGLLLGLVWLKKHR